MCSHRGYESCSSSPARARASTRSSSVGRCSVARAAERRTADWRRNISHRRWWPAVYTNFTPASCSQKQSSSSSSRFNSSILTPPPARPGRRRRPPARQAAPGGPAPPCFSPPCPFLLLPLVDLREHLAEELLRDGRLPLDQRLELPVALLLVRLVHRLRAESTQNPHDQRQRHGSGALASWRHLTKTRERGHGQAGVNAVAPPRAPRGRGPCRAA